MTTQKPPLHLTPKSRKLWTSIHELYELEPEAAETLRVALENLDLADRARALLDREGLVLDGKRHPALDALKQCHGMYLRALRQLGLDVVQPGPIGRPPGSGR